MQCQFDGLELKYVPGGVSKKTGKPYEPFYSCPSRNNSHIVNIDAPIAPQHPVALPAVPQPVNPPVGSGKPEDREYWDKRREVEARQSMAQTALKAASELNSSLVNAGLTVQPYTKVDALADVRGMAREFFQELLNSREAPKEEENVEPSDLPF